MASIASKNLFDLLGNDPELDPDRAPEPPTKAIDKTAPRSGKRNAGGEAPTTTAAPRGGARGGARGGSFSGNERAFRDGGSYQNRANPPQEGERGDFRGRGRGARGARGAGGRGRGRDDRHSKTGISEHEKQAGHGWGYNSGNAELTDEKAGEALAKEEEKEGFDTNVPPPVNAEGDTWAPDGAGADDAAGADGEGAAPAEPEVVTKSYDEHLAEIAEKKLQLGNQPSIRKPNEGASKKFPEGKAFSRDEVENFIEGSGGKAKRERAKKEKTNPDLLKEIDPRQFLAPDKQEPSSGRGGRGRGRGGDRGGDRGSFRGRGRGGGGDRGSRGDRPDFRGGRGGRGGAANVNVDDTSAFPSLGS